MSNFKQLLVGDLQGPSGTGNVAVATFSFVNSTDQVEVIFQVPDDAGAATVTISRLGYNLSATTGTSPVMEIRLESVGTDGNPTGSLIAAGANATFTPSGTATFNWVNLTTPYTANRGDWLAWVIKYSSGTINASNRPIIGQSMNVINCAVPYAIGNVATVRTRVNGTIPIWGFGSAGKAFGFPAQTVTNTLFATTNERALRFLIPQSACSTYKVIAVRAYLRAPDAGKTVKAILYSGTTALQTVTWDSDFSGGAATQKPALLYFQDATLATLVAGQEYRIAFQPQDAATNIGWYQIDFASNADLEALPGGLDWYLSTRASGGATAWTDTVASRPIGSLVIGDMTAPSPGIIMAG